MFIKDTINNNDLVFIKSKQIRVFPCGRRRSELIDKDGYDSTVSDRYYIPFDPEARLNTEANQRKHSGLNGYKQSFINYWIDDGNISLVIGGYLFNISSSYTSCATFGTDVASLLGITKGAIFANIKIANIEFFSATEKQPGAETSILRDQSTHKAPLECLDLLYGKDKTSLDSYYFSGLSFSSKNLATPEGAAEGWISLPLLDYKDDAWAIHEASRLPKIDHGDTKDSVKIPGGLTIEKSLTVNENATIDGSLTASEVIIKSSNGDMKAVTLEVAETTENKWQLKFYNAKISPQPTKIN